MHAKSGPALGVGELLAGTPLGRVKPGVEVCGLVVWSTLKSKMTTKLMKTPGYSSIQQFQQYVELRDYAPSTKAEYVRYLRFAAQHLGTDPDRATEEQLREFFLHLRRTKRYSPVALNLLKCSLRLYYLGFRKLGESWRVFSDLRIKRDESLPMVLSPEEVGRLLGAVRQSTFRMILTLIYHCGLRVREAVSLQVHDILSARGVIHVRAAKGRKHRLVPVAPEMVQRLRDFWRSHRHAVWLFPSPSRIGRLAARQPDQRFRQAPTHISTSSVQLAFRIARRQARIQDGACVHTLRHCFATHLLEAGVSLRHISEYLGHRSIETTAVYLHLTAPNEERARQALSELLARVQPTMN